MTSGQDVFLFAMPWQKASWPSLALGSLKGQLHSEGIPVRACHFHLECAAAIGWARYDAFADCWGAGEALYGALLDPDDAARLVSVASEILADAGYQDAADWARGEALTTLSNLCEEWLERERPQDWSIVGGSVGAMQLCGTLYMMRRVRELGHKGARILGGSGLVGDVGPVVLERCDDIDTIVTGEGENTIIDMVRCAAGKRGVPGTLYRDNGKVVASDPQLPISLSEAAPTRLDDYFESARSLGIPPTALKLSFEYSRGCAWEHRTPGELRGCTFCGLYRNSPNHRVKPIPQVVEAIEAAVTEHRVLDIGFVDAYLPSGYRDDLLEAINKVDADIQFFSELRCDLDEETVQLLSQRAGRVQLGVESFSTEILRHIGKGVSGAQSVHSVRLCQEQGIEIQYNLMTDIPGVSPKTIQSLNDNLPALFGLPPPSLARFYLDRNSLAFADPIAHGIDPESLDRERPDWLCKSLGDSRINQLVPFEPTNQDEAPAWRAIDATLVQWASAWRTAQSAGLPCPLYWQDGGSWARIVDARGGKARIMTIEGVLYDVMRACENVTSKGRLVNSLPGHPSEDVLEALHELVKSRLVLEEGSRMVLVAPRRHSTV
ncbi:MAG: radical SAM protein [Pseudomonadota bacterium]